MTLLYCTERYWIFQKWSVLISVSKARFPKHGDAVKRAFIKGRNGLAFSK